MLINTALQIVEGYGKLAAVELGLMERTPKALERFAKCVACPHLENKTCKLCTCDMSAKVLVIKASCPLGLWQ